MGRETLNEEYFSWLYNLVSRREKGQSYVNLCKVLHQKKFRWFVHNDDNRCADGKALRDLYIENQRLDDSHLEVIYFLRGDCTVFEMMVALAQRMNDLMYDLSDTQKNKTPKFFHHMLENLTLDRFRDRQVPSWGLGATDDAEIDDILENMMDRTYGVDGFGGLFPLKKRNRKDQSTVEIWYQMMAWMDENYG